MAEDNERAVAFRLPAELHDRLMKAAKERSLSAEIRRRLELSFAAELRGDPKTRQLTDAIAQVARDITAFYPRSWHQNPASFEVFKMAVDTLLAYCRPRGEPAVP